MKKTVPKTVLFSITFFIDFGWVWAGFWDHLGRVWCGLGRLSGALGRLLAVLGAFKIEFFSNNGPSWSPRGLKGRVWKVLDRVLGGFREVWGGFGEALGTPLGRCGRPGVELASHLLRMLYVSGCATFCYRKPHAASLRPAERQNFR